MAPAENEVSHARRALHVGRSTPHGAQSAARQLRGDLDWITLKALEKDRGMPLRDAVGAGADIRRSLRNEPVTAGPAGVRYRARKYARRHRLGLAAAGILVLLLAAFAVTERLQPTPDHARARPGRLHHQIHDGHVQGLESQPGTGQQSDCSGNPRESIQGHRHGTRQRSGAPGADDDGANGVRCIGISRCFRHQSRCCAARWGFAPEFWGGRIRTR